MREKGITMNTNETMTSSAPVGMSSKKKIIIVAAVAAAVVLVALGIILAVVLGNRYLDKMKDFDPVDSFIYNGYEIVNEDGLYYLTKDGKKVSKTGYISLESVNSRHYENSSVLYGSNEGVQFYDYFIARKQDADTYFLIDGEGEELTVVGEDLEYETSALPYVVFVDNVTGDKGVISLEALDSDLSSVTGSEIEMDMFDTYTPTKARKDMALYSMIRLYDEAPGADAPKYYYADAQGKVMFTSISTAASEYVLSEYSNRDDGVTLKDRLFLCSDGKLYNGTGELLDTDIVGTKNGNTYYPNESKYEDFLAFYKQIKEDGSETEYKEELKVYSKNVSFAIDGEKYTVSSPTFNGAVLLVAEKNTETLAYAAYDMNTGDVIAECDAYSDNNGNDYLYGVVTLTQTHEDGAQYIYVDTETGKALLTSKYGDMLMMASDVMYSPTENAEILDETTSLHFVAPGKTAVQMSLAKDEGGLKSIFTDGKGNNAYVINKTNNVYAPTPSVPEGEPIPEPVLLYTEVKTALIVPFATGDNAKKSEYYDDIQYLKGFAEGAGIAFATDYASSSYKFIDVVSGAVVKTVSAGSAENMTLTTVEYVDTYALFNDYDCGVELAVYKTVHKNASGDISKEEFYAFSRQEAMKGIYTYDMYNNEYVTKHYATGALTVTELGLNVDSIKASSENGDTQYYSASKYMAVRISDWASDIYEVRADLTINKICSVPYGTVSFANYDTALESVYVKVFNPYTDEVALYDKSGKMILGFHDSIIVCDEEYLTASRQGVWGAYKYDAEKGRVKQIIDFDFAMVEYVGDGGFLVYEEYGDMNDSSYSLSGEVYLYKEKKLVKSERITNVFVQPNYYVDEASGELMYAVNYYYNFEGDLFVHRTEKAYAVVDTDPVGLLLNNGTRIISTAPTAVVYRDVDGKVISSDIIYANRNGTVSKSLAEFKLSEQGPWYTVGNKELQEKSSPVNETYVTSRVGNGGIINLYKAHEKTAP